MRYIVCAAPTYLAARGVPHSMDDLDRADCVQRIDRGDPKCATWKFARPGTDEVFEREVAGTLMFDSNDAILDAGLAGAGLVQLHTYMARPHLEDGSLVQVLADYEAKGPPISVLFPSGRHLSPKVRAFIDFVADVLERHSLKD